jgi:hypothetical protein
MPLPDHVKLHGGTAEEGLENLTHPTYPGISNPQPKPPTFFTESTILTANHETVDEVNHGILSKFSGAIHTFASYDKVVHETPEKQGIYVEDVNADYSPEYLHTLTPNGFPKANWHSKWGTQ